MSHSGGGGEVQVGTPAYVPSSAPTPHPTPPPSLFQAGTQEKILD